ncbi:hypothetical protein BGZ73_001894 [Actinomortierella ambigua]|nr:hypothetical protein BGZ73_001894 [Actinomortierella ambigua]
MYKQISFLVLLALSSTAFAVKCVQVTNNSGKLTEKLCVVDQDRQCFCLKNTQTNIIKGINGGDIKLFWSSNCKGDYNILGSNSQISGAQWVNSVSLGASGKPSYYDGFCPNWYNP